ncbi:MAG: FAD:protein FMN transferase [Candidatus Merdivicinus sp.]
MIAAAVFLWLAGQKKEAQQQAASHPVSQPILYTAEFTFLNQPAVFEVSGPDAESFLEEISSDLQKLDQEWSSSQPESILRQIQNDAGIQPTSLTDSQYALIEQAFELVSQSDGSYALTVAPLSALWEKGEPAPNEIGSALSLIDDSQVLLDADAQTIFLPRPGYAIEMEPFVCGFAAKEILAKCQTQEIEGIRASFGNIQISVGQSPDGIPNNLEITGSDSSVLASVSNETRAAVIESGPVFDLSTGYPAETEIQSAIVFCEDPVYAEWAAKLLFCGKMTPEQASADGQNCDILLIYSNGEITATDKLQDKILKPSDFSTQNNTEGEND